MIALSIFDPRHLPDKDSELRDYGLQQLNVLLDYYGSERSLELNGAKITVVPDIDKDDTLAEWRIFKRLLYNRFRNSNVQDVTSSVLASESQCLMFPNVVKPSDLPNHSIDYSHRGTQLFYIKTCQNKFEKLSQRLHTGLVYANSYRMSKYTIR